MRKRSRKFIGLCVLVLIVQMLVGVGVFAYSQGAQKEASVQRVQELLGDAVHFGVFADKYSQNVDTEATVAANEVVSITSNYNLSSNNYKDAKIVITKESEGISDEDIEITLMGKNGNDWGKVSVLPEISKDGNTYTYPVIKNNNQQLHFGHYKFTAKVEGKTLEENTILDDGCKVTFDNNKFEIDAKGLDKYSYFNMVDSFSYHLLDESRAENVIVLNDAYDQYQNLSDNEKADLERNNKVIEKAGQDGYPVINFDEYFDANGSLAKASKEIARMETSDTVEVYQLNARDYSYEEWDTHNIIGEIRDRFDFEIAKKGKDYAIVNIDMTGVDGLHLGQYKIDGKQAEASFLEKDARILINVYTVENENIEPYTGKITGAGTSVGTLLAPQAQVEGWSGNWGGTIIAGEYIHDNGEVHEANHIQKELAISGSVKAVKNAPKPEYAKVEVTKKLQKSDGEDMTAENSKFYVAVFADEECTNMVGEVKTIEFSNESAKTVTFDNLTPGEEYYFGETDSEGTLVNEIAYGEGKFIPEFEGTNETVIKVIPETEKIKNVALVNMYWENQEHPYSDGTIKLTKKVVDSDNNAKVVDDTFYVSLFQEDILVGEAHKIELKNASEKEIEITDLDYGTYTLKETDAEGKLLEDNKYEAVFSETEVTIGEGATAIEVTLTNKEKEEPTTTTEQAATTEPATTADPADPTTVTDPRKPGNDNMNLDKNADTGDSSNALAALILMIMAAAVGICALAGKKRRHQ